MNNLTKVARDLENALRAFSQELARGAGDSYEFEACIKKKTYNNTPLLSFKASEGYSNGVEGNAAEAVWNEFCRRKGWNEAHEPMALLEAPEPAQAPVTSSDDEIPF